MLGIEAPGADVGAAGVKRDLNAAIAKARITSTTDADVIAAIDNRELVGKVIRDPYNMRHIAYVGVEALEALEAWRRAVSSSGSQPK